MTQVSKLVGYTVVQNWLETDLFVLVLVVGFLSYLMDAYSEKERSGKNGNVGLYTVLHLHPQLAPVMVAVVCQTPQQTELSDVALQLSSELREAGGWVGEVSSHLTSVH